KANVALEKLVGQHKTQVGFLKKIATKEDARKKLVAKQASEVKRISSSIAQRLANRALLNDNFNAEARVLDDLRFGQEIEFDLASLNALSEPFKKSELGEYVLKTEQLVDYQKAQSNPDDFLAKLRSGAQKLNQGAKPKDVATNVLTAT